MSNFTPNYNLEQPLPTENYDIEVQNNNMGKIDTELKNKIDKTLATGADQFIVSSGVGAFVVKTVAQIKTLLGLGSAAYTASTTYATAAQGTKADNAVPLSQKGVAGGVALYDTVSLHLSDFVRQPAYGLTAGAVNVYTFASTPALPALVDGVSCYIKIHATNTGASTLNWDGKGAYPIVDGKGIALSAGKLLFGAIVGLRFNNGTGNFQLLGEGGEIAKLTNLMNNGSFENGANYWSVVPAAKTTISVQTLSTIFGGKLARVLAEDADWVQHLFIPTGHVFYVTAMMYLTNAPSGAFLVYVNKEHTVTVDAKGANLTKMNQWQRVSATFISSANEIAVGFGAINGGLACEWYVDGMMCFDLTAAYGSGNEPTLLDVDEMVERGADGNLFDKDGISYTIGQYVNGTTGITGTSSGYIVTNFIRVSPNTSYYFNRTCNSPTAGVAWYDINYNYISGTNWGVAGAVGGAYTSPANAIYMRCSPVAIAETEIQLAALFMIHAGTTARAYIPFIKSKWWDVNVPMVAPTKKWASGTFSALGDFATVTIDNLPFTPSIVILRYYSYHATNGAQWSYDLRTIVNGTTQMNAKSQYGSGVYIVQNIIDNSFIIQKINSSYTISQMTWEARE